MSLGGTPRYVALLRGINVGKAKRIAMADLRSLFEDLGFSGVRSLLNSGNVVFSSTTGRSADLAKTIARAVEDRFEIRAHVLVLDSGQFQTVVEENPLGEMATNGSRLLVSVLEDPADRRELKKLEKMDWGADAFALGSRAAYLWCAGGILDSDLPGAVGKAVGDTTTARNWNTIQKIAAVLVEDGDS